MNIGKSIQLFTQNKSEYNNFNKIKVKVILKKQWTYYQYRGFISENKPVPIVDWYRLKRCPKSRSTFGTVNAVPKVDRLLVQLNAVPKSRSTSGTALSVPEVDRLLVQVIAVPEVDRLLVHHSCINRRLVRIDFWYTTYICVCVCVCNSPIDEFVRLLERFKCQYGLNGFIFLEFFEV